jgi:hypothetical protein
MISMIPGEAIEHLKVHVDKVAFKILSELKEIREEVRELKRELQPSRRKSAKNK